MNDPLNLLKSLNRPRLLVAAARHAAGGVQRESLLRKLLKSTPPTGHGETVMRLLMIEEEMNEARRERHAGYSPARHVMVLAALIAEGDALKARPRPGRDATSAPSCLRLVS